MQDDFSTFSDTSYCDGFADASGAASDEDDFVFEAIHGGKIFLWVSEWVAIFPWQWNGIQHQIGELPRGHNTMLWGDKINFLLYT
jgi:hypothetical protein